MQTKAWEVLLKHWAKAVSLRSTKSCALVGGSAMHFLKPYIRPYWKYFIAFYIGWLVDTVIVVLIPKLFGIMLDEMIYRKDAAEFFKISGVVVFLSLGSCALYYWIYAQHHYLMVMFTFQIKIAVFHKFFRMRSIDLKKAKLGEIMSIMQDYPVECMHFLIRGVIHQINNFIMIVILILFSFKIHFAAGFMMIFLSGICGGITIFSGKRSKEASIVQKEQYGGYISWLYEMIENFLSIRLLSMQETVKTKFDDFSREMFRQRDRMNLLQTLSEQVIKGLFLLSQLSIFAAAVYLIRGKIITVGTFTVLLTYFSMMTKTIVNINRGWHDAQTRIGYIRKIQEFMSYPDETDSGTLEMKQCTGKIEMNHINFSYGSGPVFENFSLQIDSGEKVAVTGDSGCGKSTLTELLAGMIKADSGEIRMDGAEIGGYSLKSLRNEIGIMFQDPFVMEGSLKENLLLANRKASDIQLHNVIRDSGLEAYVKDWTNGMDTQIGDILSGGQKQRLALAQLCLRQPNVIILDEPTSALDAAAEREIISRCMELFRDKTMIIVTHRSQVEELCDRVVRIGGDSGKSNQI